MTEVEEVKSELLRLRKAVGRETDITDAEAPTTLHGWLRLAIDDVERALAAGAQLRLSTWMQVLHPHEEIGRPEPICTVCLAGAVLLCERPGALAAGMQPTTNLLSRPIMGVVAGSDRITDAMLALDKLRQGCIQTAAQIYYDGDERLSELSPAFGGMYLKYPELGQLNRELSMLRAGDNWQLLRPYMERLHDQLKTHNI